MKNILLDTDIGGDCDDAGALVLLKTFCVRKEINLCAVTSCTTMEGAENTIAAVLGYYGMSVPIGVMREPPFMCSEEFNRYAKRIKEEFRFTPATVDAVSLMRRTLAESREKITVLAIGPQRNLARLLKSGPDENSPLDGISLVGQKAEELVIMGGCFLPGGETVRFEEKDIRVEWNIEQDVSAARIVAEQWPSPVVYSPFELGYDIETGRLLPAGSPARRCYDIRSGLTRASWDVCASYYAAEGCGKLFSLGEKGKVLFDEEGRATFLPSDKGRHRILLPKAEKREIEKVLDQLMQ